MAVPSADVQPDQVKNALNLRHANGQPSLNLSRAGVLVHVLDGALDTHEPWRQAVDKKEQTRDFLSATLLSSLKRASLYKGTKATALVLSPLSKVSCGYPQDSGSLSWNKWKVATPGCGPRVCTERDVPYPKPRHDSGYPCYFTRQMLDKCLGVFVGVSVDESAYTEIVRAFFLGSVSASLTPDGGRLSLAYRSSHRSTATLPSRRSPLEAAQTMVCGRTRGFSSTGV